MTRSDSPQTGLDIIERLSDETTHGITEYDRRGRASVERSYAEIGLRARQVAAGLRAAGVAAGDTVFLQLSNGCELVESFLGAIAAKALPCCLAPPRALGGLEAYQERMRHLFEAFPGCHLVAHEETGSRSGQAYMLPLDPADHEPLDVPSADPAEIAFYQLTSGTTHAPKAVRISHGALVSNLEGILGGAEIQASDVWVSWLPLYHDMGLVGMLLTAVLQRQPLHLFRPETFVARPLTWLKTISSIKGTVMTAAPNFAYQHCVNSIPAEKTEGLDLSRWRIACCGAERVRPRTLREFRERFGPVGYSDSTFLPCYGMAEASLAVTFSLHHGPPAMVDGHVSCGRPVEDTRVVIRDIEGHPLPDGEQGEITVKGPGLCSGYTSDAVPPPIRDGWLYTGDRGFLADGALYITGRFKDTIIIDGHNLDPAELEEIADEIVRTPSGRSAAIPVEVDERERVVLVVETTKKHEGKFAEWRDLIDGRVASAVGFRLLDLVFVRRGTLPTTSSGKVRHRHLRALYESGELESLGGSVDDQG